MNFRGVLFLLGRLLLSLAAALLVPAVVAWTQHGADRWAFTLAAVLVGLCGGVLERLFRQSDGFPFGRREAFVLVTLAWVMASVAGAIPFVLYNGAGFWADALFESASGFTTTGASILTDIEIQPAGLLLWRSLTHWIGGMGIIVLGIAVLPKLAVGGMELLGAEAPGPITEKMTPRIAQTAKLLWVSYTAFTLLEVAALMVLGVGLLDAVNHSMATMATGGFSTLNRSVGGFDSWAIEVVVLVFMVIAGANFALHYQLLRGKPKVLLRDPEFRLYIGILGVATFVMAVDLLLHRWTLDVFAAIRHAAFQAATIVTTTGFATVDFDTWPNFSKAVLFLLMFVGGCAGSTGGSVKVVRMMIVLKKMGADLRRMVQPHAVLPVRVGSRAIPDEIVGSVTTFFLLYLTLFAVGGLILALLTGLDLVSAFSASAACLGNVGPGFGRVGATMNYAFLPASAKIVLFVLMIVGRLELYTVLVILFLRPRLAPSRVGRARRGR